MAVFFDANIDWDDKAFFFSCLSSPIVRSLRFSSCTRTDRKSFVSYSRGQPRRSYSLRTQHTRLLLSSSCRSSSSSIFACLRRSQSTSVESRRGRRKTKKIDYFGEQTKKLRCKRQRKRKTNNQVYRVGLFLRLLLTRRSLASSIGRASDALAFISITTYLAILEINGEKVNERACVPTGVVVVTQEYKLTLWAQAVWVVRGSWREERGEPLKGLLNHTHIHMK